MDAVGNADVDRLGVRGAGGQDLAVAGIAQHGVVDVERGILRQEDAVRPAIACAWRESPGWSPCR